MKFILQFLFIITCTSCFKTSVNYECKNNCVPLVISGKITNATTGNLNGVANKILSINYHRKHYSKPCNIGYVATDINGNYSLTASVDTADLRENIGYIEIEPSSSITNNYYYTSSQSFKFNNYNNGNYTCDIALQELVDLSVQINRTFSDSFRNAIFFPSANYLKDVAGTFVNIKFTDSIKNRIYKYKVIANSLVKLSITKHSGIFDTIAGPLPQQLIITELNNVVIKDSILCLPNVLNTKTILY